MCKRIINNINAEWSSLVARRAHNPKVGGSNPPPATIETWQNESSATFFAFPAFIALGPGAKG